MLQWPIPKDVEGLRDFLGLIVYYKSFVKGYGATAKPLTDANKKDGFKWGPAAKEKPLKTQDSNDYSANLCYS